MKLNILALAVTVLWLAGPARGQAPQGGGKAAGPAKKEAGDNTEVEVRFVNGSTVFMTILQEPIEVQTEFGKLTIPAKAIRTIEFGLHLPAGAQEKINGLIKQLGSKNYRQRDAAVRDLAALGAYAYPALQRAARDKEQPEAAQRAQAAIQIIERKVPARLLRLKEEDVVRTTKFPVIGRILNDSIKARTEYFGEVSLKPYQLFQIRCLSGAGETEVVVDAARYGSAHHRWMDTGVTVDPNLDLRITAAGQVDLWPQGPGQYVATPGGSRNGGGPLPGGVAVNGVPVGPGVLVGRVGEDGPAFVVGERYRGRPARAGRLYLHIIPSGWNNASTGSYRVRITTGASLADGGD
jgi:hypothetical protein